MITSSVNKKHLIERNLDKRKTRETDSKLNLMYHNKYIILALLSMVYEI